MQGQAVLVMTDMVGSECSTLETSCTCRRTRSVPGRDFTGVGCTSTFV